MKHNASMTFFNIAKGTLVLALILFLVYAASGNRWLRRHEQEVFEPYFCVLALD